MRRFALVVCLAALLGIAGVPTHAADTASARKALNTTLPDLKLDSISLADALDFIRDVSNVNIHVNWKALEEAGVSKDATVNVHLRSVPLRKVLNLVLAEAGNGSGNLLTYYVDENVIEVTTRELADKELYTKIYPVDDLLMDVPDFTGPSFSLQTTNATKGGGGSASPLSGSDTNNQNQGTTRAERAQQLIDTIESIIQPDIWNTNGGPAAIKFWNGSLIVTAPRSVHEALGGVVD